MASGVTTAKPVVNNLDKEKKLRTPKGSKPPPSHPTYLQMITEAITSLKERTGSSQYAIAAYIDNKYQSQLPPNFKKLLTVQLRNLAKSGKLTKVKNSFKLSEELKKRLKPKAARPVKAKSMANKPAAKSKAAPGPKKVSKPAKTPPTVAKVLNVSKPKPAASTEKIEKVAAPAKKGATMKKGTPGKKLAAAKKPAKAAKRAAPLKSKKVVPAAKKAKK
eukprot:PITA_03029